MRPAAGRDTFHIVTAHGVEVKVVSEDVIATVAAQQLALDASEPVVFLIKRRSLFGPERTTHRVWRDEHRNVHTRVLVEED